MIEIQALTKRYGGSTVVDDLSFSVRPGRVTGFLGPNGAGKSTTLRITVGLATPTAGSATVDGKPYAELPDPLRRVGALLEATPVQRGRTAVIFSALSGWIGHTNHDRPTNPTLAVAGGFMLFSVAIGVFGLTMMTGEFHSGVIRATLTAVPRRLPVLWAKAVVLVCVTLPSLVVAYFGSFLAYQAFTDVGLRISLGDPGIVRALFGAVAATVAAGLIALGIGTALRSTAGAISVYVLGLVVLPSVLLSLVPASLQTALLPYFPTLALQGMFQVTDPGTAMFSPGVSSVVVLGWVILMLSGAAALLRRRDV